MWSALGCVDDCLLLTPAVTHDDLPEFLLVDSFFLPNEIRGTGSISGDTYVIPLSTFQTESFTKSWTEVRFDGTADVTETQYVFLAAPEPAGWLLSACGVALLAVAGAAGRKRDAAAGRTARN